MWFNESWYGNASIFIRIRYSLLSTCSSVIIMDRCNKYLVIYYRLGCCQNTLSCDLRYLVTHVSRLSGRSQTPRKKRIVRWSESCSWARKWSIHCDCHRVYISWTPIKSYYRVYKSHIYIDSSLWTSNLSNFFRCPFIHSLWAFHSLCITCGYPFLQAFMGAWAAARTSNISNRSHVKVRKAQSDDSRWLPAHACK